jgi:hypothetical protein
MQILVKLDWNGLLVIKCYSMPFKQLWRGFDVHKIQGHIQLGQKGVTVPRVGVTKTLRLSTVDMLHEATGTLEVMSMPSRHVVVVGRDFMANLGILVHLAQREWLQL